MAIATGENIKFYWFDLLIWLIHLFKLWHLAKPFFHARVHKITTYNTDTNYNTYIYNDNRTTTTYNDNRTTTTYNDNYTTTTYSLNTYKDYDKKSMSLKSCCGSEFHHVMAFWHKCCFDSSNLHWGIIAEWTGHLVL